MLAGLGAFSRDGEPDDFAVHHVGVALEHLLKAYLAFLHPALIVDAKDFDSLLHDRPALLFIWGRKRAENSPDVAGGGHRGRCVDPNELVGESIQRQISVRVPFLHVKRSQMPSASTQVPDWRAGRATWARDCE
jgi:hypothetical protein